MAKPKVSVVIPSWNRKDDLRACLNSLEKQDYKNREIIVVENGSTDGTTEMIRNDFKRVKIVQNPKNLGVSLAKNQGIAQAKGKYVWFLDSDSEAISKNTLNRMIKRMENDPKIGTIGGEIRTYHPKQVSGMNIYWNGASDLVHIKKGAKEDLEVDFLVTANCLTRKKLLEDIGGFDPDYFYFGEDKELGYRIKALGYKNIVNGRTGVLHKVSKKTRVSKIYTMYKNTIRFAIKNFTLMNLILLPLYDIIYLIRPETREMVGKRKMQDIAGLKPKGYNEPGNIKKYAILGFHVTLALIYGYCWNIVFLPKTVKARFDRKNHIR